MTMKKKILTTLSVVLILGLAALGILAYLSDTDSDVNVMTLGNVDIEQVEKQLAEDGVTIEPFEQGKELYPNCEISKIVSVKNVGESDAYVRTLIAFETIGGSTFVYEPTFATPATFINTITKDGVNYDVYEVVYPEVLAAGTESAKSLTNVKLAASCTNEDMEALGGTYDILVLSQAVQTEGFNNATTALETAFPKGANNENVPAWFDGDEFDKPENLVFVSNAEELQSVLQELNNSYNNNGKAVPQKAHIVLKDDIVVDSTSEFMFTDSKGGSFYLYHVDVTLDLNGKTIKAEEDALMAGNSYAIGLFIVRYSNLNIIGEGNIITENQAIPVYGWAHSDINIYGGNYISNSHLRNESAVYVNNSSVTIHVYGGTYTGSKYAFNTHDTSANSPVIVLHEGVTFKKFLKNGTTDVIQNDINNERIVPADGCEIVEYEDNGVAMYKVVKK